MFPSPRVDPPEVLATSAVNTTKEEDSPIVVARKRSVRNSVNTGGLYGGVLAMSGSAGVPWLTLGLR